MEDLQVASVTLLIASIGLVTKSDCSSMHEKGTTLIVVTHNQIVADRACKVIQMLDGTIELIMYHFLFKLSSILEVEY